MQDVYIETETLTQPFRFAMVASRAAAVLKGIQQGRGLDQKSKQALTNAAELFERAVKGGSVLRDKDMAEFSAEAMSAYRILKNIPQEVQKPREEVTHLQFFQQVASDLHALIKNPTRETTISKKTLRNLFVELTEITLNESAMSTEEVTFR